MNPESDHNLGHGIDFLYMQETKRFHPREDELISFYVFVSLDSCAAMLGEK